MQRIVLTVDVNVDQVTQEEFEMFLGAIDEAVYGQWGDAAQFFFQPPHTLQEEIVTYSEGVAEQMRDYLNEFGVNPDSIVNND